MGFVCGVAYERIQFFKAHTDKFIFSQLFRLDLTKRVDHERLIQLRSKLGQWLSFQVVVGEKSVDCFKTRVVLRNGDVKKLVALPEFDAENDVEDIALFSILGQCAAGEWCMFFAYPQHFDVGSDVVDLRQDQLVDAAAAGLIEEREHVQGAVLETEGGVAVEEQGVASLRFTDCL